MGFKLSRKTKKFRESILFFIKKRSFKLYKITISIFSILKFINKKFKKKSFVKFSDNLNDINKYEFKITSQNNEDGIIEYIFNKIGLNKINFVEIGFDFYQNNSLNFLGKANKGLFIDGSEDKVIKLKSIITLLYPFKNISVLKKFIDKDNLNLIIDSHFHNDEEIDFFSIDVDGIDYYLFETLKVRPKVICIEYNFWFGPDIKCSIPYDKNFTWKINSIYSGASLNSLCDLAKRKGYYLIALESHCVNAFFIRSDLKNNFDIIDNIKYFRTPNHHSDDEIKNNRKLLLENYTINIFN
tara:strand:+ start:720 stop:1613 length:894 start_codon:yes stop_codon:yes gene_type:complete